MRQRLILLQSRFCLMILRYCSIQAEQQGSSQGRNPYTQKSYCKCYAVVKLDAEPEGGGAARYSSVTPFFHVFGAEQAMNLGDICGAALCFCQDLRQRMCTKLLPSTGNYLYWRGATMYVAINNSQRCQKYDLSSTKICISGAGTLHVEVQNKF